MQAISGKAKSPCCLLRFSVLSEAYCYGTWPDATTVFSSRWFGKNFNVLGRAALLIRDFAVEWLLADLGDFGGLCEPGRKSGKNFNVLGRAALLIKASVR